MGVLISEETKLRMGSLTKAKALIEKVTGEKTKSKFVDEIGGGVGPRLRNFYDIWIPLYDTKRGTCRYLFSER